MKYWILSASVLLLILYAFPSLADDVPTLNLQVGNLLEEVFVLDETIADLKKSVDDLENTLSDAKGNLQKVSAASSRARDYRRQIKLLEPEWQTKSTQLTQKIKVLQTKLAELSATETKLKWAEDKVIGPLFKTVGEFLIQK